eukprot:Platyproteum_vivax@DN2299_c0_g1_i2.p1
MQTDEQIVARMCSSYRSTFTLGALMQAAPPEWTQDHMLSILQKLIERRILEMDLGPLMDRTSSTAKLLNQLASPHTDKYRLRFNFKHMLMKRVVGQMVLDEHRRSIVRSRMKTVYTMHRLSKLQTRVLSVITELKSVLLFTVSFTTTHYVFQNYERRAKCHGCTVVPLSAAIF